MPFPVLPNSLTEAINVHRIPHGASEPTLREYSADSFDCLESQTCRQKDSLNSQTKSLDTQANNLWYPYNSLKARQTKTA